jgi:DNA-nicking Smr family endonuclease
MTQHQARAALAAFLRRLHARGGRCGLVITGKGRSAGGAGEGVLRRRLPEWLAEPDLAALGAGYAPAHRRHGGEGAWYVFVKRRDL